jgi:hypothetical protein
MAASRQYEIVLLGASGYTGELCARHITTHLPTDLKWAVAGRNAAKLKPLVGSLRHLNRDRLQPDILTVQLNKVELHVLAQKTRSTPEYNWPLRPLFHPSCGKLVQRMAPITLMCKVSHLDYSTTDYTANHHSTGEVP